MHARGQSQWQSRRKMSLGPPVRRAHPASGATWNVQVVRGKMTSRCLWHACRALMLGILLMMLGAGMATIGYYAEHLSIGQEIRGNATVRVKNESRGFHLNNLSYVGPIVMGFGGFIVVAACVMTFEARDSAAKVVPARFKLSTTSRTNNPRTNSSSRRTTASAISTSQAGSQTNRWENHLGVFRTSPAEGVVPDRKALTAALVHFSKALGSPRKTTHELQSPQERRVSRSGSVPNLATITAGQRANTSTANAATQSNITTSPTIHKPHSRHRCTRNGSVNQRSTYASIEKSSPYLHPSSKLQYHRHAMSVDEAGPYYHHKSKEYGTDGSAIVGTIVNENSSGSSNRLRDRTKRSDTARRHVLSRQKPIEKEEPHSPKGAMAKRSIANISDVTNVFRRAKSRGSLSSRTPSSDSRGVQTEVLNSPSVDVGSGTKSSTRNIVMNQLSTPSVEREYKSQLSMSSEARSLSGQSSLDPCLPEESPDDTDTIVPTGADNETTGRTSNSVKRPDTLFLHCNTKNRLNDGSTAKTEKQKFLYRSSSSRMYKRPKPKVNVASEFDKIYFISSNKDDDCYDSIDVIDERRSKNFKQSGAGFCRSSTVIYSEYCSGTTIEPSTDSLVDRSIEAVDTSQRCANGQQCEVDKIIANDEYSGRSESACIVSKDNGDAGGCNDVQTRYSTTDHEQTTITVRAEIAGCGVLDADIAADD